MAAQKLKNEEITMGEIVIAAISGVGSSIIRQRIDDGSVNMGKALEDGIIAQLPQPFLDSAVSPERLLKNRYAPTAKDITKWGKIVLKISITWVRSWDPNDMIGPPGYGNARFISLKTPLTYKIRFENDPNATAPAQHVIVLHTLDQDLDIRTF
ncbi:hypothetical protein OS493_010267 [Desmophyllum pertusum]|uniref:DUF7619 domain-containing protein n=1 Tax=Desmophyllum pertusum TaxID=174260 RepID=A0A9X0A367_9CNID|nr:hypothetical protein OS493_010267 [Desmophyllum pertusum]